MLTTVLLVVGGIVLLGLFVVLYQINNRLASIDDAMNRDEEERAEIQELEDMWNDADDVADNVIDEKLKVIKSTMANVKFHLGELFPANIVEKREHITRIIDTMLDDLVPEVPEEPEEDIVDDLVDEETESE